MISRISSAQTFLFPITPRELASKIGLNWWAAKKIFDDKWLSFDPENTPIANEGTEAEFTFLGTLVAAGADPLLLDRLLNGLERPYQYDIRSSYYDWKAQCWNELPVQRNPYGVVAELISNCLEESDTHTLLGIRESVQDALGQLGISDDDHDENTDEETGEPTRYEFDPDTSPVISAARKLVWSLASSPLCVKASEVITLGKLFRVLQRLPEVTLGENLRLDLSGPKRMFGTHEISHHWEIRIEDSGYLVISATGHFYRPETGGDSFTSMTWQVSPECEPDEISCLHAISIVDDADTFENEVAGMDFNEPGYSLEVEDDSLEEWIGYEDGDNDEIGSDSGTST